MKITKKLAQSAIALAFALNGGLFLISFISFKFDWMCIYNGVAMCVLLPIMLFSNFEEKSGRWIESP